MPVFTWSILIFLKLNGACDDVPELGRGGLNSSTEERLMEVSDLLRNRRGREGSLTLL